MKERFKKKWLLLLIPVAILLYIFFGRGQGGASQSVSLFQVERKDLLVTLTADGEILSDQSVELNPQSSGKVTRVHVDEGQKVAQGQLLLSMDATEEAVDLKNAKLDLELAELDLEELEKAADESEQKRAENDLLKAQNDLEQLGVDYEMNVIDAQVDLANAKEDLAQEVVNAYSLVSDLFIDLPGVLTDIESILYDYDYQSNQRNIAYYKNRAHDGSVLEEQIDGWENLYKDARTSYNTSFDLYNTVSASSTQEELILLMDSVYATVESTNTLLKSSNVILIGLEDKYSNASDIPTTLTEHRETVDAAISVMNPHLVTLSEEVQTLQDMEQDIADFERDLTDLGTQYEMDVQEANLSIQQMQLALDELLEGATDEDIRSQEIEVEKRENALLKAQKAYGDKFIYAPFAGIVTSVDLELGQSASTASTAFTLVSSQKMVEAYLNEIDIAQLKIGQPGTAQFEAFPGEEVATELVFISEMNNAESNVVEYKAHFVLKENELALKEGMSAEIELILDKKEQVLVVPRLAILLESDADYVERATEDSKLVFAPKEIYLRSALNIQKIKVTVGLMSSSEVEIVEGLEEGAWVLLVADEDVASAERPADPGKIDHPE